MTRQVGVFAVDQKVAETAQLYTFVRGQEHQHLMTSTAAAG
jgi:hypothetical protein